jgi:hypothetical protein
MRYRPIHDQEELTILDYGLHEIEKLVLILPEVGVRMPVAVTERRDAVLHPEKERPGVIARGRRNRDLEIGSGFTRLHMRPPLRKAREQSLREAVGQYKILVLMFVGSAAMALRTSFDKSWSRSMIR